MMVRVVSVVVRVVVAGLFLPDVVGRPRCVGAATPEAVIEASRTRKGPACSSVSLSLAGHMRYVYLSVPPGHRYRKLQIGKLAPRANVPMF